LTQKSQRAMLLAKEYIARWETARITDVSVIRVYLPITLRPRHRLSSCRDVLACDALLELAS